MAGRRLSHYRILQKLGEGGMGKVYLAEDTRLGRKVALKLLPAAATLDPQRVARFDREARALAALEHPGIVTVFSLERAEDRHFLTMELVEGRTLDELIPARGMRLGEIFDLAIPLAEALAAAHETGIVHRDLKPANVMVTPAGAVKVLDFGLAKLRESALASDATDVSSQALTESGVILGTRPYMSPEQLQGQESDPRSDLYSLGVILYEMATGRRPFEGSTPGELLSSILTRTPAPVQEVRPRLPPQLGRIVRHCLDKDPRHRFQTALDVRNELADLRQEIETDRQLAARAPAPAAPVQRLVRARPAVAVAAIAVVALVVGAIFWARGRPRSAELPTPPERAAAPGPPSVVVLPFDNLTGEPELDWLRRGLTEMLVSDLSQSAGLRVLDTTRLQQILRQLELDEGEALSFAAVQTIGRQAGAGLALLGSFARAGPQLRINARLQETASGEIRLSEQVEGEGDAGTFALVDELAERVRHGLDLGAAPGDEPQPTLEEVTTSSFEAYRYYSEGSRLLAEEKPGEALLLLQKAVDIDPDFAMAWARIAIGHARGGSALEAHRTAERALQVAGRLTPRERLYIEGLHYSFEPGTLLRAIDRYNEAVRRFPDHRPAREGLVSLYLNLQRFAEAIPHLEQLVAEAGDSARNHLRLASAHAALGEVDRAGEILSSFLRRHPDSAAGHRYLAEFLTARGSYDDALAALATAERLEPGVFHVDQIRWEINILAERWQEAERAAARSAVSPTLYVRFRGIAMQAMTELYRGRLAEAAADLERAADLVPEGSPEHGWVRLKLGWVRHYVGDLPGALEIARAVTEAPGADREQVLGGRVLAALALAALGRVEETEAEMAEVRNLHAIYPRELVEDDRHMVEGLCALARGDYPTALEELEAAAALLPNLFGRASHDAVLIWSGLGQAYAATGDLERAIRAYETLAGSGPARLLHPIPYLQAYDSLAELYERRGEASRAAEARRRLLDHWEGGSLVEQVGP